MKTGWASADVNRNEARPERDEKDNEQSSDWRDVGGAGRRLKGDPIQPAAVTSILLMRRCEETPGPSAGHSLLQPYCLIVPASRSRSTEIASVLAINNTSKSRVRGASCIYAEA